MTRRRSRAPRGSTTAPAPSTPAARHWPRLVAPLAVLALLLTGGLLLVRLGGTERALLGSSLLDRVAPLPRPGGRIALIWQQDVWVVDARDGSRQRLTRLGMGQSLGQASWAPDGTRLAVSQTVYPAGQALGVGGLYLLPAEGGSLTPLLVDGAPGTQLEQPAWSPDGTSLVFAFSRVPGRAGDTPMNRVERVRVDGQERTPLIEDAQSPALSRDGRSLAFVRRQPQGETLWLAENGTDSARQLIGERQFLTIAYPRFSPDGARLAFAGAQWPTAQSSAGADLAAADGTWRPLRDRVHADSASAADAMASIHRGMALNAIGSLRLLPHLWSAAGAAAAARPLGHGLPTDLWTVARDGSGLRRITSLAEDDGSLAWSPDGQWLAFQGLGGLYLVHYETGRVVRLADRGENAGIDWAP